MDLVFPGDEPGEEEGGEKLGGETVGARALPFSRRRSCSRSRALSALARSRARCRARREEWAAISACCREESWRMADCSEG